jgi:hypothetical protein
MDQSCNSPATTQLTGSFPLNLLLVSPSNVFRVVIVLLRLRLLEITEPAAALTFIPTVTNVTCNGEANGRVDSGLWRNGSDCLFYITSFRSHFSPQVFDNLAAGNQIVIQDKQVALNYMML